MLIAILSTSLAGAVDLSGVVTDAEGAPVEGIYVVPYDQRLVYPVVGQTDAQGRWELQDLPEGPWRLRFVPPWEVNLAEEWLDGGLSVCASRVLDQDAAELEVELDPGASIRGVLLSTDQTPVVDAVVVARSATGQAMADARYATTDEEGAFQLLGLPPEQGSTGLWWLEVEAEGWPDQYLGATYDSEEADTWELAPGESEELGQIVLLDGITIQGTITGPDGPVEGGAVQVYSPSQVVTVVPDEAGVYLAEGLPPGDVLAWFSADGYGHTYNPSSDHPVESVSVPEEGQLYEGLDIEVPYEAVLSGRLLGDGDLSGVTLLAYNETGTVGIGAQCESDGYFEVHRLHEGRYSLQVWADDEGYVNGRVRDEDGEVFLFEVPDQAHSELYEFSMPESATVRGRVTDLYTGEPVYGAYVWVRGDATGEHMVAVSDREGEYEIKGLLADDWTMSAEYAAYCPGDPSWVRVWYEDRIREELSMGVPLGEGDVFEWNPALPPDHDQDQMDDEWEREVGLDPEVDDSGEDPDGDGYDNLAEYLLGTDPLGGMEEPSCGGCRSVSGPAWLGLLSVMLLGRRRRQG